VCIGSSFHGFWVSSWLGAEPLEISVPTYLVSERKRFLG
jgi:hypothetical protein